MQDIILKQFQQHLNIGDRDSARQLIRQYIKDHPDDADGWYLAATLASKEQRIALFNKALAIDPFHDKTLLALKRIKDREQVNPPTPQEQDLSSPSKRHKTRPFAVGLLVIMLIVLAMLIRHNQRTAEEGRQQVRDYFEEQRANNLAEQGIYQWRGDGGVWTINYRTGDVRFRPDD